MNQHQSKGLDLEIKEKDDQPSKNTPPSSGVIRKSFRIPPDDPRQIYIDIANVRYEVINFDVKGVSFRTTDPKSFKVENTIEKITLIFKGKKFQLSGKVIHVTAFDKEHQFQGSYLCGLQIVHSLPETAKQMEQLVIQARKELITGAPSHLHEPV